MENFSTLNLPVPVMTALERMAFTKPTPIQAQAIPPALEGRDILGSAQTGTGKTGAFSIPMVVQLLNNPRSNAMVLTPTRELAVQVQEMIENLLGKNNPMKTVLLIGGESMPNQLQQLRARPRIIVGTPGRINDHLARGSLMLHQTSFLVLDETDRMLDMGFGIQLEKIFKYLPEKRQTLMFSATLPDNIVKLSGNYLKNPVRVSVGSLTNPVAKISQETINTTEINKYDELVKQLKEREGSVIVFVKTKYGTEKLATRLRRDHHSADAIHGDLRQNKRDRVINAFRDQKHRILVATDIAARGLDIPHIEHVINYDLPQCPEDYIHRIGRTGRAGSEGSAVNLLTPQDALKWKAIQRLMNPNAPQEKSEPTGAKRPSPKRRFGGGGKSSPRNDGGNGGGNNKPYSAKSEGGNGGNSARPNNRFRRGGSSVGKKPASFKVAS